MHRLIILIFALFLVTINLFTVGCEQRPKSVETKNRVAIVFPVTIDEITKFRLETEKVLKDQNVDFLWFSAEGDPARFNTSVEAALLKKPDILITWGTQITETAFGPKFKADLPIVVASAISFPEKVEALVEIGINPPRKREVAIISDTPEENMYSLSARLINSFLSDDRKVGIIYNKAETNSEATAMGIATELKNEGIEILHGIISGSEDIAKVTKSLILKGADLIVIPHDKWAVTKAATIVKICNEADNKPIPVFALQGDIVKTVGVAIGVSVDYGKLGALTGETTLSILKGHSAANMELQRMKSPSIYINRSSLSKYGITLSDEFTRDAVEYKTQTAKQ